MGRPITVSVGPLAASSATKISASQKSAGSPLVLNGGAGTAVANNICLSQTPSGAGNLTLNGSLASTGSPVVANLGQNLPIYITSAGNDSSVTFTVTGYIYNGLGGPFSVTEVITGANASTVSSTKSYMTITQIAVSGATASTVTVGTYAPVTLDTARHVLITSGGNDNGINFAITGTNWAGDVISEKLTGGSGSAVASVLDYLTVTSIVPSGAVATTVTVGTNGVAASPWVRFDDWMGASQVTAQSVVAGTANYTIQVTMDDPNSATNPVAPAAVTWFSSADTNVVSATASEFSYFQYVPQYARILLNSSTGTGNVTGTFRQTPAN